MIILWKWLFRPILIMTLGSGGVNAIDAHPFFGSVFCIVSLAVFVFTLTDLLKKLGLDFPWLSHAIWATTLYLLVALHYVLSTLAEWFDGLINLMKEAT